MKNSGFIRLYVITCMSILMACAITSNGLAQSKTLTPEEQKKQAQVQTLSTKPKAVMTPKGTSGTGSISNITTQIQKPSNRIDTAKPSTKKTTQPLPATPGASIKKDSLTRSTSSKIVAKKTSSPDTIRSSTRITNTPTQSATNSTYPIAGKAAVPLNNNTQSAIKPSTEAPATSGSNTTSGVSTVSKVFSGGNKRSDSATTIRVAVFAPLYIDEAFVGTTYTLGKSNLPKNILTGLEFYNGVMLAVDSLSQEGINAEISIYDTRQSSRNLAGTLNAPELDSIGLVIAAITNTTELKQFSDFALRRSIPLISATYPNTVGVTSNPFFVLLNSSFSVHLDGLYTHMQRFYSSSTIIAVRRPGATENFIKNYISQLPKKYPSVPLNIRWVDLKETFTFADLVRNLDSTKNNVVFVASPNEAFGLKVVRTLSSNETYRTTAIGMPTWDGIKELNKRDCGNVEIVYSTPFANISNYNLSRSFIKKYREIYYSRPSDMAFKGFETTYNFGKLLLKYPTNLVNNLSDKTFTLFNQFDIQPVKLKQENERPDYLENKKLYFIKKQEGNVKSIM